MRALETHSQGRHTFANPHNSVKQESMATYAQRCRGCSPASCQTPLSHLLNNTPTPWCRPNHCCRATRSTLERWFSQRNTSANQQKNSGLPKKDGKQPSWLPQHRADQQGCSPSAPRQQTSTAYVFYSCAEENERNALRAPVRQCEVSKWH